MFASTHYILLKVFLLTSSYYDFRKLGFIFEITLQIWQVLVRKD